MGFANRFEGQPILAWAVDDWEQFQELTKDLDLQDMIRRYKQNSYDDGIRLLFDNAPLKLNLGGETEKSKLITTDKPIGIFDFSLASRGLYRVPEYFSQKLANQYPDKFKEFELPSGVVPPNLVKQDFQQGQKRYYFKDDNGEYNCEIRQKGTTAINLGIPNSKLKFATRNKKVYLTYKKNKGKVKYVEIYSLFYFTSLSGDVQYAIRHIPAMMVADYLESIGVMTRFYMTRFVDIGRSSDREMRTIYEGFDLPMAQSGRKPKASYLFIQPIIAKEFGQEFDKELGFLISSANNQSIYREIAGNSQMKELVDGWRVYGDPDWEQNNYWEGIERYRNKYQEYVKLGIFKSKEVLPQAMLFFHDMAIKKKMNEFVSNSVSAINKKTNSSVSEAQALIDVEINPFFNWWMRMSATNLKNKIDIINSNELRKDIADMEIALNKMVDEAYLIVDNIPDSLLDSNYNPYKEYVRGLLEKILEIYEIYVRSRNNFGKRPINFKNYVIGITTEITTYAEGGYFPTSEEEIEKREQLVTNVITELQNF
jgi:hypothetical protein